MKVILFILNQNLYSHGTFIPLKEYICLLIPAHPTYYSVASGSPATLHLRGNLREEAIAQQLDR